MKLEQQVLSAQVDITPTQMPRRAASVLFSDAFLGTGASLNTTIISVRGGNSSYSTSAEGGLPSVFQPFEHTARGVVQNLLVAGLLAVDAGIEKTGFGSRERSLGKQLLTAMDNERSTLDPPHAYYSRCPWVTFGGHNGEEDLRFSLRRDRTSGAYLAELRSTTLSPKALTREYGRVMTALECDWKPRAMAYVPIVQNPATLPRKRELANALCEMYERIGMAELSGDLIQFAAENGVPVAVHADGSPLITLSVPQALTFHPTYNEAAIDKAFHYAALREDDTRLLFTSLRRLEREYEAVAKLLPK